MRTISILLLMAILPFGLQAQRSVKNFYNQFSRGEETVKFKLPGFLIHMGGGIARKHIDDENGRLAMEMTKYIKNIRILVVEDEDQIERVDTRQFLQDAIQKDNFEELITVRDEETNMSILVKDRKGKKITNMLILVQESSELVMLSMKTNLKYKHLELFIREIMKREKIKIEPPKDAEDKIEMVIPRA